MQCIWILAGLCVVCVVLCILAAKQQREGNELGTDCIVIEPEDVYNAIHFGVGSPLYGKLEDGTQIRTSRVQEISEDGKLVRTESGSRYRLR